MQEKSTVRYVDAAAAAGFTTLHHKSSSKTEKSRNDKSIVSFLHRRLVQLRIFGPASSQTFLENIHPRFVVAKVLLQLLLLQYQ